MSEPDDHYPDLLGPATPPERRRLVTDLDHVYAASRLPVDRDAAIARMLDERADALNRRARASQRSNPPSWLRQHRALASAAMLATAVSLGGAYAALHGRVGDVPARPLSPSSTGTASATFVMGYATAPNTGMRISLTPAVSAGEKTGTPAPTGTPISTPPRLFSPSPTS